MDDWRDHAECRQYDPELFFPERYTDQREIRVAISICNRCEVIAECSKYRKQIKARNGIWAGKHYKPKRRDW